MINSTIHGNILKTEDYDKFKLLDQNRNINQRNYGKLVTSMKERQLVIPIVVNGKMEIIDGQHRFNVCRDLGLPVYYYMEESYGIDEVILANSVSANWNRSDFLDSHMKEGNETYIQFEGLMVRYNVSLGNLIKTFSKVQGITQGAIGAKFDQGTFTLKGHDIVIDFLVSLSDFEFFEHYQSAGFVGAFIDLFFHPDYDHEVMKFRIEKRASAFEKKNTMGEYLAMLTRDIYSFGAVKKPLFYDAETQRFYS